MEITKRQHFLVNLNYLPGIHHPFTFTFALAWRTQIETMHEGMLGLTCMQSANRRRLQLLKYYWHNHGIYFTYICRNRNVKKKWKLYKKEDESTPKVQEICWEPQLCNRNCFHLELHNIIIKVCVNFTVVWLRLIGSGKHASKNSRAAIRRTEVTQKISFIFRIQTQIMTQSQPIKPINVATSYAK